MGSLIPASLDLDAALENICKPLKEGHGGELYYGDSLFDSVSASSDGSASIHGGWACRNPSAVAFALALGSGLVAVLQVRHTDTQTRRHTDKTTHRQDDTQTRRHTDKTTHRQDDTQTRRHTDKTTHICRKGCHQVQYRNGYVRITR